MAIKLSIARGKLYFKLDAPCVVVDDVVGAVEVVSIVDEIIVEELVIDDDELDEVKVELGVVSSVEGSLVGSIFLSCKILIISFIIVVYLLCS